MNVWKVAHPRGRSIYANLTGVDTPDPLTATLRFSKPAPYVMNSLAGIEAQILPKHLYDGTDLLTNPHNIAPVGTGPFRFVEWKRGQYVALERNPDYWDQPRPYLDRIVIRFIPDAGSRSAAFEANEIDLGGAMPVALADARRLAALPTLEIPTRGDEALAAMAYIEFNLRKPPFNDVRVRRAIAHAIDRDFLLKNVWYGFGKPSTGPVSHAMGQYYSADVPAYKYDIALAQSLLDEAGFKRGAGGIRFRMMHDPLPGSDFYSNTGEYFRAAMQRIGIAVEVRNQDFASYYRRIYTDNDFDTTNFVAFNLTDPTMGVQRFYWSKNIQKGVIFSNGSGYANPRVDALLEAAQVEVDPAKRRAQFAEFQKITMEELPNIPIADVSWFTLQNRKVQGAITSPFGAHDSFAQVSLAG
jgi:peptide/nickel transport system substrate-binding protein